MVKSIEMYLTHDEAKPVVTKKFLRSLKNKIYKYLTPISKDLYITRLDDIVKKYNNTYHRSIKMEPAEVKPQKYMCFNEENSYKSQKFKVGVYVIISKYKNVFAKGYVPNWSEKVFVIKRAVNVFKRSS